MNQFVNMEAEYFTVGSMILEKNCIPEIMNIINDEDFHFPQMKIVYRLVVRNYQETSGEDVDVCKVVEDLKIRMGMSDPQARETYLQMVQSLPSAANAAYYAKQVRLHSQRRQISEMLTEKLNTITDTDPSEMLGEIANKASELLSNSSAARVSHIQNDISESLLEDDSDASAVTTGIGELDRTTGGFKRATLTILAAASSMGKSALMLDLISRACYRKKKVLLCSLEMNRKSIQLRLSANWLGQDIKTLSKQNPAELKSIIQAGSAVSDYDLWVDDRGELTIERLAGLIAYLKLKNGLDMVCLDYLQLMRHNQKNIREGIVKISRGLKMLAMKFDVPIIALSQLNRASQTRDDRRPRLTDLRESGSIESDADIVMLLHREDYYRQRERVNEALDGTAELIIAKNREGQCANIKLVADLTCGRFNQLSN